MGRIEGQEVALCERALDSLGWGERNPINILSRPVRALVEGRGSTLPAARDRGVLIRELAIIDQGVALVGRSLSQQLIQGALSLCDCTLNGCLDLCLQPGNNFGEQAGS